MTTQLLSREAPLNDEISAVEAACRDALDTDYPDLARRLPSMPGTPAACFELLHGIPFDRPCAAALRRLGAQAHQLGLGPYAVERFVVLSAYLAALPRLTSLQVHESVIRQYCITCRQIASPVAERDRRLAPDSDAFAELARIVTFRRFHAGQLSFDIMNMPRAWLLKVHPLELPRLIHDIGSVMGGFGPVVMPHLCYWRPDPIFAFKYQHERALWRVAKCVEQDSRIKGLVGSSWLYSTEVGRDVPHLAWLRDFFVEQNASVFDAGPALADAGFLIGSEKRRRLYAEGKFRPRETVLLWRRSDLLAWARSYQAAPAQNTSATPRGAAGRRSLPDRIPKNGNATLIDCKRLLYYRPRHYIMAVMLLPVLSATVLAAAAWTIGPVIATFTAAFIIMWLFQYYCLQ